MQNINEETIEIFSPKNELEGNIICDILNNEGIEARYLTGLKDWWKATFVQKEGRGSIIVFKKDFDRAKTLIEDYLDALKKEASLNNKSQAQIPLNERNVMENINDDTVEFFKPKSELEANIIRDILKQDDIESGFKSNWSSWYDGLFVTGMGLGSIFVFKKDADRAKKLIEEYFESLKDNPEFNYDDQAKEENSK